jgi:hypothetical protein
MAEEHEQQPKPKIGAGHLKAMIRAGAKELTQALPAFPDSNIRPVEEPGLVGNLTPQEIVHGKNEYDQLLHGYASRAGVQPEQDKERGMSR